jgi:hypothetical protein
VEVGPLQADGEGGSTPPPATTAHAAAAAAAVAAAAATEDAQQVAAEPADADEESDEAEFLECDDENDFSLHTIPTDQAGIAAATALGEGHGTLGALGAAESAEVEQPPVPVPAGGQAGGGNWLFEGAQ